MADTEACPSRYTFGGRDGEVLACALLEHAAPGFRGLSHRAEFAGVEWFWNDAEADK